MALRYGVIASVLVFPAVLLTGCQPIRTVQRALQPPTPHETYTQALETAGLLDTALARQWVEAAQSSLSSPSPVDPPFEEVVYVDPGAPRAISYAVTMRRGQHLTVEARLAAERPARVFVDAFESEDASPGERPAASAEEGTSTLRHTASRDGVVVVRVQPELLRGGELHVRAVAQAAFTMPVEGATARHIQGLFGAPRDGGRRVHEGIDIFAPRGTPVLAATSGLVTSVGENALGGRVVWLLDARGYTHYYAHLDTQQVGGGTRVSAGDVIGTVGNTGNARTTAPHLHFGLYASGKGAVDPRWFVQPVPQTPAPPVLTREVLGRWVRIARARTPLRSGPGAANAPVATLDVHTAATARGGLATWVRLDLPDGTTGFVQASQVTERQPWRRARTSATAPLRAAPGDAAPTKRILAPQDELSVLGWFGTHLLVRITGDEVGWVPAGLVG